MNFSFSSLPIILERLGANIQASNATCPASAGPFSPRTLKTRHCYSVKPCFARIGLNDIIIASLALNMAIGRALLVSGKGLEHNSLILLSPLR